MVSPVGRDFLNIAGNKVGHDVKKNLVKLLDLPINVGVCAKVLGPRKTGHTFLNSVGVGLVVMPHFSFSWGRRRNFEIYLTMDDLMMTLWIQRGSSSTVQNKIGLVSDK